MSTTPLICLEPTNSPRVSPRLAAARPASLERAVVGLVSNTLGRSRELLLAVFDAVTVGAAGAAGAAALEVVKPHKSVPPTAEDWQRLTAQATVAITGFGG
jgi:hypothetical protein